MTDTKTITKTERRKDRKTADRETKRQKVTKKKGRNIHNYAYV